MGIAELLHPIENLGMKLIIHVIISDELFNSLQWCHNEHDGVSNPGRFDCLLYCLFRHRWKKTSKLCAIGLCEWNPPMTGGFPLQRSSIAENVFIWWRHQKRAPPPWGKEARQSKLYMINGIFTSNMVWVLTMSFIQHTSRNMHTVCVLSW